MRIRRVRRQHNRPARVWHTRITRWKYFVRTTPVLHGLPVRSIAIATGTVLTCFYSVDAEHGARGAYTSLSIALRHVCKTRFVHVYVRTNTHHRHQQRARVDNYSELRRYRETGRVLRGDRFLACFFFLFGVTTTIQFYNTQTLQSKT